MPVAPEPETHRDTYFAGAYWGPREESAEECARRAVDFLNLLASCDPRLASWNKIPKPRGKGRKTPLMPPDEATLTAAFRRGVNREPGGPPIDDLGLTVSAYNDGDRGEVVFVRMLCGSYAEGLSNACVLDLPSRGVSAEQLTTVPMLTNVLRAMISSWEPDWAIAGSSAWRSHSGEPDSSPFFLNWLTYLSKSLGRVPPLPAPVRIEPVEDRGTLIILTPERFTMANPEHVALARRVRELLDRAGLTRPIESSPSPAR